METKIRERNYTCYYVNILIVNGLVNIIVKVK